MDVSDHYVASCYRGRAMQHAGTFLRQECSFATEAILLLDRYAFRRIRLMISLDPQSDSDYELLKRL